MPRTCGYSKCENDISHRDIRAKFCSSNCKSFAWRENNFETYRIKATDAALSYKRGRKQRLVERVGGKCELCGYNKCMNALEFHHLDSTQKADIGHSRPVAMYPSHVLETELRNCILLCANCHREVEAGISFLDELIIQRGIRATN